MITVVIPLYNKENQIANTLQLVIGQTFQDFEIVIINDGSTDRSAEVVSKFVDSRIRLINQQNAGVSAARNRGIDEAKGEYVAFLDADDEWHSTYLETIHNLIQQYPSASVFATRYKTRDVNGVEKDIVLKNCNLSKYSLMNNYFNIACMSSPPLWTSAVCVKKDAIINIGGFPLDIKSGEDLLTWARLAVKFEIAYSNEVLATFNVEQEKVTDKPKRVPAEFDYVGSELQKLYIENKNIKGLRRYIANWKKMRSSNYMRLGMRTKSIKEALNSLWYYPLNYKIYLYIVYNIIPHK